MRRVIVMTFLAALLLTGGAVSGAQVSEDIRIPASGRLSAPA